MSKSSLEAATEAAAKVNAMLVAKGKLKLFPNSKPKAGSVGTGRPGSGDLITAEVDINDAPLSARNLLTRGHTQDEICKLSGAAISTRGRYMTAEERQTVAMSEGRPLYLHVQAATQQAVDVAVKRIQDIINQHVAACGGVKSPTVGNVTYPSKNVSNGATSCLPGSSPLSSGPHYVQDKVFVGLEQAPPTYPVREKILGPGGSFLQHIRTETGATVTLRGKGSGYIEPTSGREAFEPLYIHITHPKLEGLQAAKALAVNLVDTAHVEYAQWQQQQSVIQSVTPVIIPQGTALAYQNQVLVTPAVIPVATKTLPSAPNVVAARLPVPGVGVSVSGVALSSNIPSIVQNSIAIPGSIGVPPVSVVTSIPVSVQGIPSQAVITYPTTYVAEHNPVIAGAATARSLVDVSSHLPVSSAYPAVTSQASLSTHLGTLPVGPYPSPVQPVAYSQPMTYSAVDGRVHLNQVSVPNSVVVPQNSTNYSSVPLSYVSNTSTAGLVSVTSVIPSPVVQSTTTAYPHIPYPRTEFESGKRKFCEDEDGSRERAPEIFSRP